MTGPSGGPERRRFRRRYVQFSVRYRFNAEGVITDWKESGAENVSAGGLFMTFGERIEPGRALEVEFTVPGAPAPVRAKGTVVWARERVPGVMVECGLEFSGLSPEDRRFLAEYSEAGEGA